MRIGFVGLGKMGYNMCLNLIEKGNEVVVYDVSETPIKELAKKGAIPALSVKQMFDNLPTSNRVIWIMVPAGKQVDNTISKIVPHLRTEDIIIDGGNSYFEDSIRRKQKISTKGVHYLDVGTSGGIEGARNGACMMIGGNEKIFKKVEKLFKDMCVNEGYGYMGESGAGHFVKAVHNAIEYGMMGALAEGFIAIEKQAPKFKTDLKEVSKVYANGSIIEGRLTGWLLESFKKKGYLENISCEVPKGETEEEMKKLERLAFMPILHQARMMRVRSREKKVCGRLVSALRNQFGGHKVIEKKKDEKHI